MNKQFKQTEICKTIKKNRKLNLWFVLFSTDQLSLKLKLNSFKKDKRKWTNTNIKTRIHKKSDSIF